MAVKDAEAVEEAVRLLVTVRVPDLLADTVEGPVEVCVGDPVLVPDGERVPDPVEVVVAVAVAVRVVVVDPDKDPVWVPVSVEGGDPVLDGVNVREPVPVWVPETDGVTVELDV